MSSDPTLFDVDLNPRYQVFRGFRSRFLHGVRSSADGRDIYLYLPEAYLTEPERRFPVFYLHDGQNLFDPRASYIPDHTWRVAETADELTRTRQIEPVILIGVANTGVNRMAEYTPTRDLKLGGGKGPLYARFLIEELKPHIDKQFRTLPGPATTALGGSSLGGLISMAIGLEHPDVFGKLAILSPSVWWNSRSLLNILRDTAPQPALRIWLDIGTAEGRHHILDTDVLHERLLQKGWRDNIDLRYVKIPDGLHNEDAWADRFDQVLRFLFPVTG